MNTETDIVNIQNFPIMELVEIREELTLWVSPFLYNTYSLTANGFRVIVGSGKNHSINLFCKHKIDLEKELTRIKNEKAIS
jgi:hypothetical protein